MRSATLRDVAQRAGVSMSTVSRVLSGANPTAPTTQAKVMRAVKELDYVANAQARALAGAGTKTVAVLVGSMRSEFHSHVAQGVEEQAVDENRLCVVCVTRNDPERELAMVRLMREQRAGAVILIGGVVADPDYDTRMRQYAHSLAAIGSRLVLVGRPPLDPDVPAVAIEYDNRGGAYAATSFLVSQGHRRILYLGHAPTHTTFADRLEGYRQALADHGIEYDESLIVSGWLGRRPGYQMMIDRLKAGAVDFTAIFAGDDLTASGALHGLREHDLRVPDDISLVGYNDLPIAYDLQLTTVHIPHEELGRAAVRLALHANDDHGHGPAAVHRRLGTHLVIRDSVRPLTRQSGDG